jgi:hypothetical protein
MRRSKMCWAGLEGVVDRMGWVETHLIVGYFVGFVGTVIGVLEGGRGCCGLVHLTLVCRSPSYRRHSYTR